MASSSFDRLGPTVPRALLGSFQSYWYPFKALVRRDLQKRYAKTMLGLSWAILQPLALLVVYFVVFGFVLRSGRDAAGARDYAFFMLSGMLPYFAVAEGLHRACVALREDRALLDRVEFRAAVIPASRVASASIGEIAGLGLIVAMKLILGMPMSEYVLALPLLVALRIVATCGVAWFLSTLALFVADLTEVLSFSLTALLFLTPIFYSPQALPAGLRWTLSLNPLHQFVECYRSVLLPGRAPLANALEAAVWTALLALAGAWFFRKTVDRGKDFL